MATIDRVEWRSHEFVYRQKSADWFWYVGFVAALLAIGALYLGNLTFAAVIVIAAFTLMLEGGRAPREHTYAITRRGVQAGDDFIPYHNIRSYTIHDDESPAHLILDTDRALRGHVMVPLANAPIDKVRNLLDDYLPEGSHDIPVSEHIARRLSL